jgi:hypothetical protein
MSDSFVVAFKVTSDCSPPITNKIVSGFNTKLLETLQVLNEAISKGRPPYKIDVSFVWFSIFSVKENPEKVEKITYRIKSTLFTKDGDEWKEIPGYEENFGIPTIPETLDQSDSEVLDELFDGIAHVVFKVCSVMLPH